MTKDFKTTALRKIETFPGLLFLCAVPFALGNVVELKQRRGKVIAVTDSGIEMIVPAIPATYDRSRW